MSHSGARAQAEAPWSILKEVSQGIWHFDYQEQPDEAVVLTDSDWGACKRTRKSMSSYAERFGKHLIDSSCAKQSVIALSSGEAELYALVRGAAAGLLTVQVWERVGFKGTKLTIKTDSFAAKGIAARKGSGKVKHLSMKELWIQDCVQKNRPRVQKEPTKTKWADLGTKALSGSRVSELVKGMPLTRGLVMACLFASFGVATGQPKEDKLENVDLAYPRDPVHFVLDQIRMCLVHETSRNNEGGLFSGPNKSTGPWSKRSSLHHP